MLPSASLILSLVWASLIYAVLCIHPELSALVCIMHELGLDSPQWSESAAQSMLWALHVTSLLLCMQTLWHKGLRHSPALANRWGRADVLPCAETWAVKAVALLAGEGRKGFWRYLCTALWRSITALKCHFKRPHGKSALFCVMPSSKRI